MKANPVTKRLCWIMVGLMLCDFTLTLAGQPSSYWKDYSKPLEFNSLVAWAMRHGPFAAIALWSVYTALAIGLIKLLRGRLAMIAALTFILAHFCAASGWIVYRYNFRLTGLYLFSLAVAAVLVVIGLERKQADQALQRNAGSRPASDDLSASEIPSSLGPRG